MRLFQEKPWVRILILMLMVPLTGASIDIYVPSLPAITRDFHTQVQFAQLTVPIYLIGYSLAQVIVGSLSDAMGRRRLLIAGLVIYCLASLLAPLSPSITVLMGIRFIQGIAVSAPGVLSRAIASDSFSPEELPPIINYITIAWATGPILAPVIGGYLQAYFNWHAPFYFLALLSGLNLILVLAFLPETIKERHPLKFTVLLGHYKTVLSHRIFISLTIMLAIFYAFLILFNVVGPFLIQSVLGYSPITFGHMALCLGLAWFLGSVLNRLMIRRVAFRTLVLAALIAICLIALGMLTLAYLGRFNLLVLVLPTALMLIAASIAFTNCFATCVRLFPKIAGTASSAMGCLFVGGAALAGILATLLKTQNQIPLSIAYLILSVITLGLFLTLTTAQK